MVTNKRWKVRVVYIPENYNDSYYFIEELSELHDLIDGGPDFHLIRSINIEYNYNPKRVPEFEGTRFCG